MCQPEMDGRFKSNKLTILHLFKIILNKRKRKKENCATVSPTYTYTYSPTAPNARAK